ncbi:hypothetical protein BH23CHL7_BH23CHL7_05890 [soil metagenome]
MAMWTSLPRVALGAVVASVFVACASPVPAGPSPTGPPAVSPGTAPTLNGTTTPAQPTAQPASAAPTSVPTAAPASAGPSATASPFSGAWIDVTAETIGTTAEWTNKVELADINGDGLVDILFANGGNYDVAGAPVASRVFANRGAGEFEEVTESVSGGREDLTRVVKVRDLNSDGHPDILLGTTFQTQSRLFLGTGNGVFTDVTESHLPRGPLSVGDLEIGDVDGDGDLDMVLADWGVGSPMRNQGGLMRLWLNDGEARFTDATDQMPITLVGFSWDIELLDVENDWDLDLVVSCKVCPTSLLYENDGDGRFTDVTEGRMPPFRNNYEFAPMDLDGDGFLDLVTINDGTGATEHIFRADGRGGFTDVTADWWPRPHNAGYDDNVVVFLDVDSDGDADFLIGSLDGPDRLMINGGSGNLTLADSVFDGRQSGGTLGMAVADLNGDRRPDVVEGQGEVTGHEDERVYFGTNVLAPDTASPVIATDLGESPNGSVTVHARVHDNRTPNMPHDWQSVELRWTGSGGPGAAAMTWYGENLFRVTVELPADASDVQVCAVDAVGNEGCS